MKIPLGLIPEGDFEEKISEYIKEADLLDLNIEGYHVDPNLIYVVSAVAVLTRLLGVNKHRRHIITNKLAKEKTLKNLDKLIKNLYEKGEVDSLEGVGDKEITKTFKKLIELPETKEDKCVYAGNIFKALEKIVWESKAIYVPDLRTAEDMYRQRIKRDIADVYLGEQSIKQGIKDYVNMVVGMVEGNIYIDEEYISQVEEGIGFKTEEERANFRFTIRKLYSLTVLGSTQTPQIMGYEFTDDPSLVKGVTNAKLKQEVAAKYSLIGALTNEEENKKSFEKLVNGMVLDFGYCNSCAKKTIEYFCTQEL